MKSTFCFLISMLALSVFGFVPEVQTSYETTPIPAGFTNTDDTAIWLHPTKPEKSLIIGVSKNTKSQGGKPGIALYDLKGVQKKYIQHDRLNNTDLRYSFSTGTGDIDIAAASNRDKKAISLFQVTENDIKLINDLPMLDKNGELIKEEPYGFCMGWTNVFRGQKPGRQLYAFSPMKNGLIYVHEIVSTTELRFIEVIDTAKFLSKEDDNALINFVMSGVFFDDSIDQDDLASELKEAVEERHQLEGCAVDDDQNTMFFGMENFGVFSMRIKKGFENAKILAKVINHKDDPNVDVFPLNVPRFSSDIEGMALHRQAGKGTSLVVSIQGINEFAVFDSYGSRYLGNFKVTHDKLDPVTQTDGFEILNVPMGPDYPMGLMVMHDDLNTDRQGRLQNSNYKILSWEKVVFEFPDLDFGNYVYDPRQLRRVSR